MKKKMSLAVVLGVSLALLVVGIAVALSITVDGNVADWTAGALVASDLQEAAIPDQWNISALYFTNDTSHIYFRWDTYANASYLGTFQLVCIDIDPNALPVTGGSIPQCSNQVGVDYIVRITDGGSNYLGGQNLLHCSDTALQWQDCTPVVPNVPLQFRFTGLYSELGVGLADIGYTTLPLGTGNCPNSTSGQPCTTHIALYFDNGAVPPDDNVPDSGDLVVQIGCAAGGTPCSPTAVTLNNLEARPAETNTSAVVILGATLVLAFGALGTLAIRRRKQTTL
ncbi:MAG: hypothetical protein U0559_11950 [Anaerolineae bacterium]